MKEYLPNNNWNSLDSLSYPICGRVWTDTANLPNNLPTSGNIIAFPTYGETERIFFYVDLTATYLYIGVKAQSNNNQWIYKKVPLSNL